jgi:hypothetical protein
MFATGIGFMYFVEDDVTSFGFVMQNFGMKLVMFSMGYSRKEANLTFFRGLMRGGGGILA